MNCYCLLMMSTALTKRTKKSYTKEEAQARFETSAKSRRHFFRKLKESNKTTFEGWCWLTSLVPTKAGGYVQVSFKGHKFKTLNQMAGFMVYVRWPTAEEQASHRCSHANCFRPGCIVYESAQANNKRKNCAVWVTCPHADICSRVVFVCQHDPPCTKHYPGLATSELFLSERVHREVGHIDRASQEETRRETASQVDV
jgi:hypothetical protein